MRTLRVAAVAALIAGLVAWQPSSAAAGEGEGETDCQTHDQYSGTCQIEVQQPTNPADPNNPNAPTGSTGDSGPACYFDPDRQNLGGEGHAVPCNSKYGYWSNAYDCFISLMKPPPPSDDPVWQGHEPGDGAIYNCYQPDSDLLIPIWAGSPPEGPGQQITPYEVAQIAVEQMNMTAVGVGLAPTPVESNPKAMGVIGLPVWMWVNNPTASTYSTSGDPLTESASAGGITVTARAYVERVEWDMGDGSGPMTCGAGTEYNQSVDQKKESPDCGYTYTKTSWDQPNHQYTVTASSYWRVDWAGAGQSGTIRLPALVSTVNIREGELQVLNKNGAG